MPELPEVHRVLTALSPLIIGSRVARVRLVRDDILRSSPAVQTCSPSQRKRGDSLFQNQTIIDIRRHGKELALISDAGKVICVHLGMTGQLRYLPHRQSASQSDHIHCTWHFAQPQGGRLMFRDVRRFGGLRLLADEQALQRHWSHYGPDALQIPLRSFREMLQHRYRPIKAALLDQQTIAGIGNIYADEALFDGGIHPLSIAAELRQDQIATLHRSIRRILKQAIACGGSTIRDYIDSNGRSGTFASRHKVYGRSGQPCFRCGSSLASLQVAQRTTVICPHCQPAPISTARVALT